MFYPKRMHVSIFSITPNNRIQDFDDLLKFIFRKRRGRRYVDRGDYILTTLPTRKPIEPSEWKSYVKPRATIAMDIVLHSIGVESNVSCQYCPSCGLITGSNTLEDDSTWQACFP